MAHRATALAVCLLALAASAAAQCGAGYFKMELVSASQATHEVAKCLSSVKVSVASNCGVSITSTAAGGNFVPALWTPAAAAAVTYKQYKECPVDGDVVAPGANTAAARLVAIEVAFANHIYGSGKPYATNLTYTAGKVVAAADSQTFTYVITEMTLGAAVLGDATNIKVVTSTSAAGLAAGTFTASITAACGGGRYGLILNDNIKVCPVCPAGTTGDGSSCSSCDAGTGKDGGVGATSCTACDAGTYAAEGSSDCLPCPPQTYSGASAGQCTQCPVGSYAWVPGSTGCLRCVGGVPKCSAGTMDGETCNNAETASPGFSVLQPAQLATCGLTGSYAVPAYDTCDSWRTSSVALQWSVYVAGDCSIVASPITDTSCSEPGNRLDTSYTYANLQIRAYYQTTKTIRSLLPAGGVDGSSAFLMSLDQSGSANQVSMVLFAATSTPSAASGATAVCTNANTVGGGSVNKVTPATANSCAAGSFYDAAAMCRPCPTGAYCAGGVGTSATSTSCAADSFNQYLGQTASSACTACPGGTPDYTSTAGSAYCTVLDVDADCPDGNEWEAASQKCVPCKAGTFRTKGSSSLQCADCDVGTYSAAGAGSCTACPVGQYSPTTGLAEQSTGAIKCLVCPVGSLALKTGQADAVGPLATGATYCDACPAGYIQPNATSVCTACAAGTYRSGDAAPGNNACKAIPAGYKADANSAATAITPCANGTVSYWTDASTRVPAKDTNSTDCQPCTQNTYAPRQGMANCLPCRGGSVPAKSVAGLPGPDTCTDCTENTFRAFLTLTSTCATCGGGLEVGPSSRQACTPCRPGNYKPADDSNAGTTEDAADFCTECPRNKFAANSGASDCEWCARGYETLDSGATECTPCSIGYWSAGQASQSTDSNCVAAPAGSFVNTSAAFSFTLCPVGFFSKEEASDSCDPCPPGQFANSPGSKGCRTCQAGTFSSGAASACRSCQAGYFSAAGSSQCSPCKPGTFTSTVRSGTCAQCPRGKQCPTIATATPRDCPRGYFSNKEGSRLCTACAVNTFASGLGSVQCQPCAPGTSTRGLVGQSACVANRVALRRSL